MGFTLLKAMETTAAKHMQARSAICRNQRFPTHFPVKIIFMSLTAEQILDQSKQESQTMVDKILSAKTAVVTAHVNPDGDTLGSMLALAKVLEQAGVKRVDRVMHDPVPDIYKFFPDQDKVKCSQESTEALLEEYDLSFSCDCGSIKRLGSAGEVWQRAKTTCNVDHHLSNPLYADLNWVDPNATCTGQVVKELAAALKQAGKNIETDAELASLYYITLLTDTGGFMHSNTTGKVFAWAAELIEQGANPSKLYHGLFNQMPFRAIKVIGAALDKLELIEVKPGLKLAYTYTLRSELAELEAKDEDTDEIVDHIMRIKEIQACLYLREAKVDGHYKGSLRSAIPELDCSVLASQLNGGGHARAAGFNLDSGSLEELKEKVLNLLSS